MFSAQPTCSSSDINSNQNNYSTEIAQKPALPPEILFEIFTRFSEPLAGASLRNVSLVNKEWKAMADYARKNLIQAKLSAFTDHPEKFQELLEKLCLDPVDFLGFLHRAILLAAEGDQPPPEFFPSTSNSEIFSRQGVVLSKQEIQQLKEINLLLFPPAKGNTSPAVSLSADLRPPEVTNAELLQLFDDNMHFLGNYEFFTRNIDPYLLEILNNMNRHMNQEISELCNYVNRLLPSATQELVIPISFGFEKIIMNRLEQAGSSISDRDIDLLLRGNHLHVLRKLRDDDKWNELYNDLQWCAICGTPESLNQFTYEEIAHVNQQGRPPLFYAALRGDVEMVEGLLRCGANPDFALYVDVNLSFVFRQPVTPLSIAIAEGNTDCAKALVSNMMDPFIGGNNGRFVRNSFLLPHPNNNFLIMLALEKDNVEILRTIFEYPESRPQNFIFEELFRHAQTPTCSKEMFAFIVDIGSDHIVDPFSLLLRAVKLDSLEGARKLLQRGLNPNQLNIKGEFFLKFTTLISEARSEEMRELLKSYGGVRYVDVAAMVTVISTIAMIGIAEFFILLKSPSIGIESEYYYISLMGVLSVNILIAWILAVPTLSSESLRGRVGSLHAAVLRPFVS